MPQGVGHLPRRGELGSRGGRIVGVGEPPREVQARLDLVALQARALEGSNRVLQRGLGVSSEVGLRGAERQPQPSVVRVSIADLFEVGEHGLRTLDAGQRGVAEVVPLGGGQLQRHVVAMREGFGRIGTGRHRQRHHDRCQDHSTVTSKAVE